MGNVGLTKYKASCDDHFMVDWIDGIHAGQDLDALATQLDKKYKWTDSKGKTHYGSGKLVVVKPKP